MKVVTLDCETTTRNKGNPFDPSNRLCSVGTLSDGAYTDYEIEYSSQPYGDNLVSLRNVIEQADLVVGFNIKFDLHWLRRYLGNDLSLPSIWDCQLGEYILSNQTKIFPSLDDVCSRNGLGNKLDIVKLEYWEKGIDTPDVPYSILAEYLEQDVRLTESLYEIQKSAFEQDDRLYRLFRLGCVDLRWLLEAESNGLIYNLEESVATSKELYIERDSITSTLSDMYAGIPVDWDSSDHISVVLFGGSIYVEGIETYQRQLKRGLVDRTRKCWVPIECKQQLKPDPRSECLPTAKIKGDEEFNRVNEERKKERLKPFVRTYSVAENILRNYTPKGKAKKTIELLLKRSELNKLISTYYEGIPKTIQEFGWQENTIHGSLNQCGTRTGRLSSSKPNLQNFAGIIKPLFRSRFTNE